MDEILNIINDYSVFIIVGLTAITFLLFISTLVLIASVKRVEKNYRKMMRGVKNKNLEEILTDNLDRIDESLKNSQQALEVCKGYETHINSCVNKVAIMRYKAFEDVGSDLSFSVAILDSYNDGVIITGIYSRQDSTTYAKPIDKGISRYSLSEEEEQVLKEAVNKKVKEPVLQ